MKKINLKNNKGFTLVETLVAVSILSISIVSSLVASGASIDNSKNSQYQITAYNFAQEAMEFIKNKRDENALDSISGGTKTWLSGMAEVAGDPCYFGKVCQIDASPSASAAPFTFCGNAPVNSSAPGLCQPLRQDPVTKLYGYNPAWTQTSWNREIQFVQTPSNPNEISVIVTVSWKYKNLPYVFQISENLYNK